MSTDAPRRFTKLPSQASQPQVVETGESVAIKKVFQDKRYKNRELQIMKALGKTVGLWVWGGKSSCRFSGFDMFQLQPRCQTLHVKPSIFGVCMVQCINN